jgi:hypothetical protein
MQNADFIKARNLCLPLARVVKSLAVGQGDVIAAHAYANAHQEWSRSSPEVSTVLQKSIVAPITSESDLIASWLPLGRKLFEALTPISIFGRLRPLMERLPFRTRVIFTESVNEARFVREGDGQAYPVSALSFSEAGDAYTANLMPRAIGCISVWTKELMQTADPGTEEFIASQLLRSIVSGLDRTFLDPARILTADAPASITAGAPSFTSSGQTVAAVDADLQKLVQSLTDAGHSLQSAAWVMSPRTATYLAALRDLGAGPAYPTVGLRENSLWGLPVISSSSCRHEGSPQESFIALVEAAEIGYATDESAMVEYSTNADLEFVNPAVGSTTSLRSLWQNGLMATKTVLRVNWSARPGAAAVLTGVKY